MESTLKVHISCETRLKRLQPYPCRPKTMSNTIRAVLMVVIRIESCSNFSSLCTTTLKWPNDPQKKVPAIKKLKSDSVCALLRWHRHVSFKQDVPQLWNGFSQSEFLLRFPAWNFYYKCYVVRIEWRDMMEGLETHPFLSTSLGTVVKIPPRKS